MQFKRLRLSGFKSFAQPTELAIEPGLTGVVGPNGCGKSNLVEALRWVMGETSARGLRGGEMDDVIFGGTVGRPVFDLAEVVLQLSEAGVDLPGLGPLDELELARRIGRGTGSAFRINGKEVRARDVQLLFADASSGARSASIISQGKVGALVEARPAERRRLLEDAASVGGLQARRHEAELKLQAAEANLARLQDLLATLTEQRDRLHKQARQAKRYREISAQYRETEAALLVGRCEAARAQLTEAESALEAARARIEASHERASAARAARDEAAATLPPLRAEEAEAGTELARLRERQNAAAGEMARLEERMAALRDHAAQAETDVAHATAGLDDARRADERLREEQETLGATRARLEGDVERLEADEHATRQCSNAADQDYRRATAKVAELDARLQHLDSRRAEAARELGDLDAAAQDADARLAELAEGDGESSPPGASAAEDELARATARVKDAEAGLAAADDRGSATRAALDAAEKRLAELREEQREWTDAEERRAEQRRRRGERRGELEERKGRLGTRIAEIDERIGAGRSRRDALALDRLQADIDEAERRVEAQAAALAEIETRRDELSGALDRARAAEHEVQTALQRARTEAEALAELDDAAPEFPGVDQAIVVTDGYAEALAAGLGDDLLASLDDRAPAHWRNGPSAGAAPPALPAGCQPLGQVVRAPAALGRRLDQIGVVDAAQAEALQPGLAPGQRLVSREGGLWRWDGFVRSASASRQAATRLRHQARRRDLDGLVSELNEQLEARQAEAAQAALAVEAVAAEAERAETARDDALATLESMRRALTDARASDAALVAELDALSQERERVEAERREIETAIADLAREHDGEQPGPAAENALAALEHALEAAEAERDAAAREHEDAEAGHAAARSAVNEAREQLTALQESVEHDRAAAREAAEARQRRELERARLEAEARRLAERRTALETAITDTDATRREVEAELAAARDTLVAAEAALADARARHAEVAAELTRLRDRRTSVDERLTELEGEIELWRERAASGQTRLAELERRRAAAAEELEGLGERPATVAEQERALAREIDDLEARRTDLCARREAAEAALGEAETELAAAESERLEAREAGARLEAGVERARAECETAEAALRARASALPDDLEIETPSPDDLTELEARLARLGTARERIGPVNLRAADELDELAQRIASLEQERDELTAAIDRLRRAISALNREGRERLRSAFAAVEQHFEATFKRLFGGGEARLALTDMEDPLAAGLELAASPPGKKLQSVALLSGGEKALTALALIFAVFLTHPAPLCVLDEVDAPLDDANVGRFIGLLEEIAAGTGTRFIVITHHPLTMARMDRLYGVTMIERGVSQLVSVDLQAAVALRATA